MTIYETGPRGPKHVFIIHGHELKQKEQIRKIISEAHCVPVVIQDETDAFNPMIDKFERNASKCACAVALLTPDDEVMNSRDGANFRARQNVIFEIGWFAGRRGGHKVLMLCRGDVEIPSDLLGVDHSRFEKDVLECAVTVAEFLRKSGATAS